MIKKLSRLHISDIPGTKQRIGERELSVAELKLVGGGERCQGGTSTFDEDTDE